MSDAAGSRTPQQQALTEEIERTRERLGETVEALAAKADVKSRVQHRVTEVTGSLRGKAAPVQRSAGQAVAALRGHREKAIAAAAAVLVLAWLAAWASRRSRIS